MADVMQVRWTVVAALLVLAAPVAAQSEASFSLEQKNVTSELEIRGGESASVPMDLNLTGEGFSCTAEVEAQVNVTVEASLPSDAPPNASLTPTDTQTVFAIPSGEYETSAYSQEESASVSASAGSGLTENTTGTLTISSEYPGGEYADCLPMTFPPANSSPAEVQVSLIADDPPEPEPEDPPEEDDEETPEENTTAPPPTNESNGDEEEDNGIPFPWQASPLAAIGAALVLRRRAGAGS
jgi:hypothetical protein